MFHYNGIRSAATQRCWQQEPKLVQAEAFPQRTLVSDDIQNVTREQNILRQLTMRFKIARRDPSWGFQRDKSLVVDSADVMFQKRTENMTVTWARRQRNNQIFNTQKMLKDNTSGTSLGKQTPPALHSRSREAQIREDTGRKDETKSSYSELKLFRDYVSPRSYETSKPIAQIQIMKRCALRKTPWWQGINTNLVVQSTIPFGF